MSVIAPQKVVPILFVEEIESSLPFWTDLLGFKVVVQVPQGERIGFVILALGAAEVMLQSRDSLRADVPAVVPDRFAPASALYIDVPDIAPVAAHLNAKKAEVLVPLRSTFYGAQEIWVRAPGGHVVAFSQPAKR